MSNYKGPSVIEEFAKLNQAVSSLSSTICLRRAKRSKSHGSANDTADGEEICNGMKDLGVQQDVDKCANAQGTKEMLCPL